MPEGLFYLPVENTGALAATAPCVGSYIAKETLRMSAFATAIGNKCGLPAIQVMAILSGAFEAIEVLERDGLEARPPFSLRALSIIG